MTLFDLAGAEDFRPDRWPQPGDVDPGGDYLEFDELLSRSDGDLGIGIDGEGYLVLVEGADIG